MSLMIQSIHGREIIDSRGNPTVEAVVLLQNGVSGTAAVPSGASTGQFEALELRDADPARFGGKGVLRAVKNINTEICAALTGMDASHTGAIDTAMLAWTVRRTNPGLAQTRFWRFLSPVPGPRQTRWAFPCTGFWAASAPMYFLYR